VTCQPNVKFMQWYVGMSTSTYVGLVTKKLQNECNYFNWPTNDERRV